MTNSRFDYAILDAINNAVRTVKASPLMLGATASGTGGPPGGFVGYLPQARVTYDTAELETDYTPLSGMSLLDNLNHIRYRIGLVELGVPSGGITNFLDLLDTPNTYTGNIGKAVVVNATEDGLDFVSSVSGGSIDILDSSGDIIVASATSIQFIGASVVLDEIDNRAVVTVGSGSGGFITDAPEDGSTYGRRDATWVAVSGGSGYTPDYVLLHREAVVTTEGGTNVVNTWTALDINTEVTDASNICSVASSQFTLDAGTYDIFAVSMFYNTWGSIMRLYNTTDSSVTLQSQSAYAGGSGDQVMLFGRFTIAASKTFELQYLTEAEQTDFGLGVSMGARMSNYTDNEVFTKIELRRIGV